MADKRLKQVHIIARLNVGGPAIHVALLGEAFIARGDQYTLISGIIDPGEGDMAYYSTERGVQPVFLAELGRSLNPVNDVVTIWKLYRMLRRIKPDVVHTHTAKAGFVGRIAAWLARVPVVVHTFHGHVFHGYFSPAKTQLFLFLERFTARLSDTIITITPRLRDELADTYHITSKDHITVVPYGLDLSPFAAVPRKNGGFRQAWELPADALLVGIVGRFVPIKNHALFLEAADIIHREMPEVRFALVGDGELREAIEAQITTLGLHNVVTITGWQRDMPPIYADLDVLVISSNNEGTPFTLIEAMATGCPVVSTDVGGVADLLDNGRLGALVPPNNPQALAEAILNVLRNPPDSVQTKALTLEHYSVARLVDDLDKLYHRLLLAK
ncbi:MAG: glycosyltransferase family 4 protein [Chitinophagaceae bacterium]|nr:glycosyltransferase family 4 protein [Anaerolineae bacterium]